MSCNNRNLRNLDTNIYSSSNGCCDTDYEVKMVERLIPCYVYPPRPMPPFEPIPQPPHPPVPPFLTPTAAYALFYNNSLRLRLLILTNTAEPLKRLSMLL